MPQSYARVVVHTTFSTAYRLPLIDPTIEKRLLAFMTMLFKQRKCVVYAGNCVPDHVHFVFGLPRTVAIADVMEHVKKFSSRWIKIQGPAYTDFDWQNGYAVFSTDYRKMSGLLKYVANQKTHHGYSNDRMTFETEFKRLLDAYGMEYKLQYLFPENPNLSSPEGTSS